MSKNKTYIFEGFFNGGNSHILHLQRFVYLEHHFYAYA